MLIFRYLAKEVFVTLVSLTVILLLIFMSNQLLQYLTRAANGQIPLVFIMKLMMLELPNLIGLILPLGFFMALLLAYGRLYADHEMAVLAACGYGEKRLLWSSLAMSAVVAALVMVIMLWASPLIAIERAKLLRTTGVQLLVQMINSHTFYPLAAGRDVVYVDSRLPNEPVGLGVFFARARPTPEGDEWDVFWSEKASLHTDSESLEDYLVFNTGAGARGIPGHADYQLAAFEQLQVRLPHPEFTLKADDLRVLSSRELWPINNKDPAKAAEIQWRISVSIMVMMLTLIAVPLSRINPRAGKYANLLPALGLFFLYANFMFIARDWVVHGKVPTWLGMWWLHLLLMLIGVILLQRNRRKRL
jgi:lipopolysaccharide export system permease protein